TGGGRAEMLGDLHASENARGRALGAEADRSGAFDDRVSVDVPGEAVFELAVDRLKRRPGQDLAERGGAERRRERDALSEAGEGFNRFGVRVEVAHGHLKRPGAGLLVVVHGAELDLAAVGVDAR